jgi:hypothetical protein
MAKFQVELDDGKKFIVEADQQPTPEAIQQFLAQQQGGEEQLRTQARPDEFLSLGERASTGFRLDPDKFLEERRAELGLAPGTALEPTPENASLLENLKDIPGDMVDMLGPAFPIIGQMVGGALAGKASIATTGGVAAPMAIAKGGIAGALAGETVRQAIGSYIHLEQKGMDERAKKLALEGAYGAAGETIFLAGNALMKATKKGIIKAGEQALSQKGIEGFTRGFSRIVNKMNPKSFEFSLKSTKAGDNSIYSKEMADFSFGEKFYKKLFFGADDNLPKQIQNLTKNPTAKSPIKEMYKEFTGLSDETLETAIRHGDNLEKIGTSKSVINSFNDISKNLNELFDETGKAVSKARFELSKKAGGVDVTDALSQVNKGLGDSLSDIGILNIVEDGVYSINPSFSTTATGRAQAKVFGDFITKMFGKTQGMTDNQMFALKKALIEGNEEVVKSITRGKFFTAKQGMKYSDFAKTLRSLDVQISGKEFDAVGKLSPELATYVKGLRSIDDVVAQQVGDTNMRFASNQYKELIESSSIIRQAAKEKDIAGLQSALAKYITPDVNDAIAIQTSDSLNNFLKTRVKSDIFENIKAFKAVNELRNIKTDFKVAAKEQSFINVMRDAFSEGRVADLSRLSNIDQFLPDSLKPFLNSQRHTAALDLHKDATSLLGARFLASATGGTAMLSGLGVNPAMAGTASLFGGIAAQNKKVLRNLIKASAKAPTKRFVDKPVQGLNRTAVVGGSQLIRKLLEQEANR